MSQNTSVESSNHSSSQSIKPALQAALCSIDVQLEEELARYRRQRAGRPVMPPRGLGRHQTRKPMELISVDKAGEKTQRPALGMSTAPKISLPLTPTNQSSAYVPDQETNRDLSAHAGQAHSLSSLISESVDAPIVPSQRHASTDQPASQASMTERLTSPDQSARGDGLVTLTDSQAQPEDYLESSEQLIRSLADDQTSVESPKRSTNKLLTPLGVGSVLLLLLSSATLVYIFTNPSTLSALGLDRLFGSKKTTTAQNPSQITVTKSEPANSSSTLSGPKLDSGEFRDVNLDNLPQLEANSSPSSPSPVAPVTEVPNPGVNSVAPPTASNRSSDLSSALLPRTLQQGASSQSQTGVQRVVPIPAPPVGVAPPANTAPKPAAPENVAASPASNQNSFYYVLVNYSGDRDLAQVRKVVPDAYVEKFPQGSQIQTGAFKRESEAKTLVEQLKQQGVTAWIYRP